MSKTDFHIFCCVCVRTESKLQKLSTFDNNNNLSLQDKLQYCIEDIEWLSSFVICEHCMNILDISFKFKKTCIETNYLRLQSADGEKNVLVEMEKKEDKGHGAGYLDDVKEYLEELDDLKYEIDNDQEEFDFPNDNASETGETGRSSRRRKKKKRFSCEKCEKVYNSSKKLVQHSVKEHDMNKLDVRPFICDRCPSRFCNSSHLLQHVKYHNANRCNICTYCGKGFITRTDLNVHEKQHMNKREYRCDECDKSFNTHKDIRSHKLVVHTDSSSWKYCCEICQKRFPIKSNYDSHMRRHTGDKKFECHLCQRKFTDKCVLQRHMKTHSNIKEFKCTHCPREYKDKRVMKVHMAKVHGIGIGQIKLPTLERKYICHICSMSYFDRNKLNRHLNTHSGEKPFECTLCGKKFNDKSYVRQHMRKTHNVKENKDETGGLGYNMTANSEGDQVKLINGKKLPMQYHL